LSPFSHDVYSFTRRTIFPRVWPDKVGLDTLRCLVSPSWFILFPNGVASGPLQPEFGRVNKVTVVIDDQDARLLCGLFKGLREKIHFDSSAHDISISKCVLYWASMPPSTTREVPVVNFASSEQR